MHLCPPIETCQQISQWSALCPFFLVVVDVLRESFREDELWELPYTVDLGMSAETLEDLQRRLGDWYRTVQNNGLRGNEKETEAMVST